MTYEQFDADMDEAVLNLMAEGQVHALCCRCLERFFPSEAIESRCPNCGLVETVWFYGAEQFPTVKAARDYAMMKRTDGKA